MIYPNPTPECYAISEILGSDNVILIPFGWLENLRTEAGFVDSVAAFVLAEITYWYRVSPIHNADGRIVGYGKKFQGELLQKSYKQLAEKLGFTERQVRDATVRLENRGLIRRIVEHQVGKDTKLFGVLYIKIFPAAIKAIQFVLPKSTPTMSRNSETPSEIRDTMSRNSETPCLEIPSAYRDYNTEITNRNKIKGQKKLKKVSENETYEFDENGNQITAAPAAATVTDFDQKTANDLAEIFRSWGLRRAAANPAPIAALRAAGYKSEEITQLVNYLSTRGRVLNGAPMFYHVVESVKEFETKFDGLKKDFAKTLQNAKTYENRNTNPFGVF